MITQFTAVAATVDPHHGMTSDVMNHPYANPHVCSLCGHFNGQHTHDTCEACVAGDPPNTEWKTKKAAAEEITTAGSGEPLAGEVTRGKGKDGTVTILCDTEAQGLDPEGGGKWVLICDKHGSIIQDTNKARLSGWKNVPEEWCEDCMYPDRERY